MPEHGTTTLGKTATATVASAAVQRTLTTTTTTSTTTTTAAIGNEMVEIDPDDVDFVNTPAAGAVQQGRLHPSATASPLQPVATSSPSLPPTRQGIVKRVTFLEPLPGDDRNAGESSERGTAYFFPGGGSAAASSSSDGTQLVSGTVWAFLPPTHVKVAKIVLLAYFLVVVFATLSSLGFPLANDIPKECDHENLSHFFVSFGVFGVCTSVLLPLWGLAFFGHMLEALRHGLQPFVQAYDREKSISLGICIVGTFGCALYGLNVAPPPLPHMDGGGTQAQPCDHANNVVRFSAFSYLISTGILATAHVVHHQYLSRLRTSHIESQGIVLY